MKQCMNRGEGRGRHTAMEKTVPLRERGPLTNFWVGCYIKETAQALLRKGAQSSLRVHLSRSTAGTFALKVAFTGLSFLTSLFLARLLGAAGYGIYAYATSIVALLVIPATLGLPQLLIRNMAAYRTRSNWGLLRGLLRWSNWTALTASVVLALLGTLVIEVFANYFEPQAVATFRVAMMALPLMALSQLRQAALQGLNRIIEGQLPELLIRPFLFLIIVSVAYFVLGWPVSAPLAMEMQVVAAGIAFSAGTAILRRYLPTSVKECSPSYDIRSWMRSALPLLFIGWVSAVNQYTDILMLGALKGTVDVGIYKAAVQGATLIPFMLGVVNTAIGPTIASLYTEGDMKRLEKVVAKGTHVSLLFSLPLVLVLIFFSKSFLLLFGPEFPKGRMALAILSVGQLVNVAAGPVGLILVMTGYEEDAFKGLLVASMANVIINAFLIPIWGIVGAALANAISVITCNILLVIRVYRKIGLRPTVLGRVRVWRFEL